MDFPEGSKIVQGVAPVTTNGAVTADYISLKDVHRAWIVVDLKQAVGHATGIDPVQATAVAGTSSKALTNATQIWANEDVAATDTSVRQTDAVTYDVTNDIKSKQVIIQINPGSLDVNNDFDCVSVSLDASSQVTNFVNVTYILQMRYSSATPPTVITD
jgi:hypothetical protein